MFWAEAAQVDWSSRLGLTIATFRARKTLVADRLRELQTPRSRPSAVATFLLFFPENISRPLSETFDSH